MVINTFEIHSNFDISFLGWDQASKENIIAHIKKSDCAIAWSYKTLGIFALDGIAITDLDADNESLIVAYEADRAPFHIIVFNSNGETLDIKLTYTAN